MPTEPEVYRGYNWSRKDPPLKDGAYVVGCNLLQDNPHTAICKDIKGLTFIACNLTNCDLPEDAKVIRCQGIHVVTERVVSTRTDKDAVPVGAKALKAGETETVAVTTRTVECTDGSIVRTFETETVTKDSAGKVIDDVREAGESELLQDARRA